MVSRSCNPKLRIVPLAARGLFMMLVDVLEQLPGQTLSCNDRPASAAEIARMVSAPETEVETHLKTLVETGLLVRKQADGAISMPEAPSMDQAVSARQNGALGGRPHAAERPPSKPASDVLRAI